MSSLANALISYEILLRACLILCEDWLCWFEAPPASSTCDAQPGIPSPLIRRHRLFPTAHLRFKMHHDSIALSSLHLPRGWYAGPTRKCTLISEHRTSSQTPSRSPPLSSPLSSPLLSNLHPPFTSPTCQAEPTTSQHKRKLTLALVDRLGKSSSLQPRVSPPLAHALSSLGQTSRQSRNTCKIHHMRCCCSHKNF